MAKFVLVYHGGSMPETEEEGEALMAASTAHDKRETCEGLDSEQESEPCELAVGIEPSPINQPARQPAPRGDQPHLWPRQKKHAHDKREPCEGLDSEQESKPCELAAGIEPTTCRLQGGCSAD